MKQVSFAGFQVRPSERQVLAGTSPLPIGARAFDVLMALIEHRDRVVSKSELLELAWPGLVVEENNLSVQISSLRKALGPQAIATVTGRGYRFAMACDQDVPPPVPAPGSRDRVSRRLAAIASADVVGWRSDEVSAAQAWRCLRTELIEPQTRAFGGRVIELSAAFTLLEFPSVVDAVAWAMDVQQRLAGHEGAARALRLRIGVHVDDVIVDEDKLVGEGVDVALRIRELAAPGEVTVSAAVQGIVWKKLPVSFEALGECELQGAKAPVLVHRVSLLPRATAPQVHPHLVWERRPTVAVLPFAADNGETDSSYFGDGITEEIIAMLAMNRALLVITRNSTLRYRGRAAGAAQVALELGVRYVLTGSARRHGRRLRIHAELVDARADRIIWADGFDGADEDLFGFQKEISAAISAAIAPRVQEAEIARLRDRPTESYTAYDCVLRGMSVQFRFTEPDFELAGTMFRRAIELDPRYAQAHAHLAEWHNHRVGEGRSTPEDPRMALALSERAVELDPHDAWVLAVAGHIQSFQKKRFPVAMEMFDQALQLNPSCSLAWARSGTTLAYMGRGEEALVRVRNAMRLSPFDQQFFAYCTTNGTACIVAGRYDEAIGWLGRARRLNPRYQAALRMLAVALALVDQGEEARAVGQEFLASDPGFRVSDFARWYPLQPPHLDKVLDGLRSAGLPP